MKNKNYCIIWLCIKIILNEVAQSRIVYEICCFSMKFFAPTVYTKIIEFYKFFFKYLQKYYISYTVNLQSHYMRIIIYKEKYLQRKIYYNYENLILIEKFCLNGLKVKKMVFLVGLSVLNKFYKMYF